ncbi:hypothetical protein UR09_03175 [Candidatus Nitromaritima sp. SCGC AAA799-A02]|nr:hypothetical protein UR09_03175 [Candidatus Nitromaritima sp. SCGC AAA799-A02]
MNASDQKPGASGPSVSILTTSFPRFEGDPAGNFVYKFARELNHSGCSVRVVAPHDSTADPSWCGFPVHHFRYFFPTALQSLAYGAGMVSRLKDNGFRIFQVPLLLLSFFFSALKNSNNSQLLHGYWSFAGIVAMAVKSVTKIPVVINLWGSDLLFTRIPGVWSLLAGIFNRADAIVCESGHFGDQLIENGISPELITVIPNGIDMDRFNPLDRAVARKEVGLPPERSVLLTVGSLGAYKGHDYLIQALPEILKENKDVHLVIVGGGETRSRLESTAASLNLEDRVTLAGLQKEESIPAWFNAADIFVLPSLREGTPNVLLEAMACQLPVVATPVGGIGQLIENGRNGLLIPPESSTDIAQSVISLLKDKNLRESMGRSARETILSQYGTWNRQANLLKSLYNRILCKPSNETR